MADNIKQIKVEGVSYDLNAKYIKDGSGNLKTWQNIADMVNAGVQLVTDNARKEAAGDGAIDAPATTAAADTMGKIYLVTNDGGISGTYVEFITIDKGADSTGATGYVRYIWEKIGTTATDLTDYVKKDQITLSGTASTASATSAGAHTHSVTIAAHNHTITPTTNTFTYALKVAAHSHSYTKPTAHTHSIAQHTHSVSVNGNNY